MSRPSSVARLLARRVQPPGTLIDQIGNTPLLDLTDAVQEWVSGDVRVLAKAEWFNPGGSV